MPKKGLLLESLMQVALTEARTALQNGNFPVGAVVAIDGTIIGQGSNRNEQLGTRIQHAELSLLLQHSRIIRSAKKSNSTITLVTTLEPCLLCVGAAVLSRVTEIIYACPDPHGGAAQLDPKAINLSGFYERKWPIISQGPFCSCRESYTLVMEHMKRTPGWENTIASFEQMERTW